MLTSLPVLAVSCPTNYLLPVNALCVMLTCWHLFKAFRCVGHFVRCRHVRFAYVASWWLYILMSCVCGWPTSGINSFWTNTERECDIFGVRTARVHNGNARIVATRAAIINKPNTIHHHHHACTSCSPLFRSRAQRQHARSSHNLCETYARAYCRKACAHYNTQFVLSTWESIYIKIQ